MRILITIIFICLGSMGVMAQNNLVIGRVTDAKSGEAIREVRIYWEGHSDDKVRTDKYGVYRIKRPVDSQILIFEYSGKKPVEQVVPAGKSELNVSLEDLGATAVTASRWEQSVYETPASVVIITREDIQRSGFLSLQEVLESVPGLFTIDHRSESDVTIGIRGFWGPFNRNVMIQVNGVNMLSERQNDFPLNKINVPVEAIDKIEIVRGPMSVIYGAGAFFGVINILTNQPEKDDKGFVATGVGTQQANQYFLRYAVNREGLKLTLNAHAQQRNGFDEAWNDFTSDSIYNKDANGSRPDATTISDYRNQQINPERYSRNHESVNLALSYEGFSGSLNYASSDFGFSFNHPGPSDRNDYRSRNFNFQAGYRGSSKDDTFDYELKLAVYNSVVDASYRLFYADSTMLAQDRVSSLRYEANLRKVFLDSRKKGNLDLDLIAGLSYNTNLTNHSRYHHAEIARRDWFVGLKEGGSLDTKALYVQSNLKSGPIQFVAGLRLERQGSYPVNYSYLLTQHTDNGETVFKPLDIGVEAEVPSNGTKFIPRLALIYNVNSSSKNTYQYLKALYGQAIKQVSPNSNAAQAIEASYRGRVPVDNPTINYLRPEQITTFELGYILYNEPLDLEIDLNLFRNELEDLVTRQLVVTDGSFSNRRDNGGKLNTTGVEFILKKRLATMAAGKDKFDLDARLDLTYQKTQNVESKYSQIIGTDTVAQSKEFAPSFSPPVLGNLVLSGNSRKLSFSAHVNYVGPMKAFIKPSSKINEEPDYLGEDTSDYYRLGLNLRFNQIRFKKSAPQKEGGLFLNVRASNVLNVSYRYPVYTINPWADRGVLGRARQVMLTIGYQF